MLHIKNLAFNMSVPSVGVEPTINVTGFEPAALPFCYEGLFAFLYL